MTHSPFLPFCFDAGGPHVGKVMGTMNMTGNFGSVLVAIVFQYLLAGTGGPKTMFYIGAALNMVADYWGRMLNIEEEF